MTILGVVQTLKADIPLQPQELENRKELVLILRMNRQIQVVWELLGKEVPRMENAIANFRFFKATKQRTQEIRQTAGWFKTRFEHSCFLVTAAGFRPSSVNCMIGIGQRVGFWVRLIPSERGMKPRAHNSIRKHVRQHLCLLARR